ncbi:MAG: amino acid ABC transporter ATP-binding protein, partial [Methanomicrobia archaeon]|nr:amino acid ABC transporter ATP-binding protein [Methanomicrobia archaeon]
MEPIIRIEKLTKSFGQTPVLKGVDLSIYKGEVVAVIGSSGGGKSTLLRCMNLLETPSSGAIFIDGTNILDPNTNVDQLRAKMGMVFQSFNLFNHLSVLDNCILAQRKVLKTDKKTARTIALKNLEKVGLLEKAPYKVFQLSGGQKQRVAIARALCMNPE